VTGVTQCSEVSDSEFILENCICRPPSSGNICDPSFVNYDAFHPDCKVAAGGVHAIGCDIWLNARTDVDLRFVEDNGSITQQVLGEDAIEGSVCHNADNADYFVEKELMNGSGQLPADQWYFAEDKLG